MLRIVYKILLAIFFCILAIEYFSSIVFAQKGFKIEKVNGVIVVSNPKHPIPENGLKKRIVFKEELSIGVIEGDEDYMFGARTEFNTDDEGNFYISDYDNHRIQKYNPKGKYLLTIGRAGQGPGEFESLGIVQFDKENNILVTDLVNKRVSFFDKNGRFLRQIITPEDFDYISKTSKDYIIGYKSKQIEESGTVRIIDDFGLFDYEFNTIAILQKDERELTPPAGMDEVSLVEYWSNAYSQMAFRPYISFAISHEGSIYSGFTDKYEIAICSPAGKMMRKIKRNFEPIPVSKKDRALFIKNRRENPGMLRRFSQDVREQILKNIKFRKYKPAYRIFALMENGWLAVIVDSIENEYALIDLFDKEGRYIAQFKTDVPTKNLFFKNGKAYAVAYEEGFPFVKRYAIELQEYKSNKWVKSTIKLY